MELTPEIRKTRVAVAEDVLNQLSTSKLRASHVGYIIPFDPDDNPLQIGVPVHAGAVLESCYVCAVSALFLCYFRMQGVPIVRHIDASIPGMLADGLHAVFSGEDLALIEAAYERKAEGYLPLQIFSTDTTARAKAAWWLKLSGIDWARNNPGDAELSAIMRHIIDNNGDVCFDHPLKSQTKNETE